MRWGAILSSAAKAVATCLLGLKCAHGADGDTPHSWEVEADHRHAELAARACWVEEAQMHDFDLCSYSLSLKKKESVKSPAVSAS